MDKEELIRLFDQQAAGYDQQWARMAPIREGLLFLLDSLFLQLPRNTRILCVGVGTGAELAHLAEKFPCCSFTAVEPSGQMLNLCRQRAENQGFASRCAFHNGYVDSLPPSDTYQAATCFLISQFILEQRPRSQLFREIAQRLEPGGILASSDLASELRSHAYEVLLRGWMNMMTTANIPPEGLERMRKAYDTDVAILPPQTVAAIIEAGGFESPVQFFQAGLMHAWFSKRA